MSLEQKDEITYVSMYANNVYGNLVIAEHYLYKVRNAMTNLEKPVNSPTSEESENSEPESIQEEKVPQRAIYGAYERCQMTLLDIAEHLAKICNNKHCTDSNIKCPFCKTCQEITETDWLHIIVDSELPGVTEVKFEMVCKNCRYLSGNNCKIRKNNVDAEKNTCCIWRKPE